VPYGVVSGRQDFQLSIVGHWASKWAMCPYFAFAGQPFGRSNKT